jgi:hypothetical protein
LAILTASEVKIIRWSPTPTCRMSGLDLLPIGKHVPRPAGVHDLGLWRRGDGAGAS